MFPEEVQGMTKNLDGSDPPPVHRLQLRLHGEVLQETKPRLLKHYSKDKSSFLMLQASKWILQLFRIAQVWGLVGSKGKDVKVFSCDFS